jgi:hypothetical protein
MCRRRWTTFLLGILAGIGGHRSGSCSAGIDDMVSRIFVHPKGLQHCCLPLARRLRGGMSSVGDCRTEGAPLSHAPAPAGARRSEGQTRAAAKLHGQDAGGDKQDGLRSRVGVGAGHVAPLRVAPEEGDTIVGVTDSCHTSSLVEAVWDTCFGAPAAGGFAGRGVAQGGNDCVAGRMKRIYVRTGQQTWTGALVLPDGCKIRIIGPTSAQASSRPACTARWHAQPAPPTCRGQVCLLAH